MGTGIEALLINAVLGAAVSYAVGLVSRLILGGPKTNDDIDASSQDLNDALATAVDPGGALPAAFGFRRLGGKVLFNSRIGDTTYIVVEYCAIRISRFTGVYINNKIVTLDGSGFVNEEPWAKSGYKSLRIKLYNGSQISADADMAAKFPDWGAGTICKEAAYGVYEFTPKPTDTFQEAYGTGTPDITVEAWWANCYDPRVPTCVIGDVATYVESDNPAIHAANYIISELGMNKSGAMIDWHSVITEANYCDQLVPKKSGAEKRYTCAPFWRTNQRHEEVLAEIGYTMAGGVIPPGDKFIIWSGRYIEPTEAVTEEIYADDGFEITENTPIDSLINSVRVKFSSPGDNWEERDAPVYQSAVALAADGEEFFADLSILFCTSHTQAQRLAKISYMTTRFGVQAQLHATVAAIDIISGDIITVSDELLDISGMTFRVQKDTMEADDGLTFRFDLRHERPDFYAWDAATEEKDYSGDAYTIADTFSTKYAISPPGMIVDSTSGSGVVTVTVLPSNTDGITSYGLNIVYDVIGSTYGPTITPNVPFTVDSAGYGAMTLSAFAMKGSDSASSPFHKTFFDGTDFVVPAPAVAISKSALLGQTITATASNDANITLFELYEVSGSYSGSVFTIASETLRQSTTAPNTNLVYVIPSGGGSVTRHWRTKVYRGTAVAASQVVSLTSGA